MAYYKQDYAIDDNKTLPDYQNFRNILFTQWEELNNINCIVQTPANKLEAEVSLKEFRRTYKRFFGQINHDKKLNKLKKVDKFYLIYFDKNLNKINTKVADRLTALTRYFMEAMGVFEIEAGGDELF